MDKNGKRPRIPSARDLRILLPDGTELPVEEIGEAKEEEAAGRAVHLVLAVGDIAVTITFPANDRVDAWLRYLLLVRPRLYEPLEYRLN